MNWDDVTPGDLFKARPEGPYGEIRLYPRKECPICGERLIKLSFRGEQENLLETNEPVKILESLHPVIVEIDCPNCGHRVVRMFD